MLYRIRLPTVVFLLPLSLSPHTATVTATAISQIHAALPTQPLLNRGWHLRLCWHWTPSSPFFHSLVPSSRSSLRPQSRPFLLFLLAIVPGCTPRGKLFCSCLCFTVTENHLSSYKAVHAAGSLSDETIQKYTTRHEANQAFVDAFMTDRISRR